MVKACNIRRDASEGSYPEGSGGLLLLVCLTLELLRGVRELPAWPFWAIRAVYPVTR